ncbi:integrase [Flavobacteriaceae bacterium AU392]|nr:integrase [Flavobacteriaceae bacterium]RKM86524.1 integrase [Flavobacteriaceae bacterium AU392]
MNVKFFIRKSPKQGKSTIHVRVRIGRGIDLSMATKESVFIEDWDSTAQCLVETYNYTKNGKTVSKRDAATKIKIHENKKVNYRLYELKRSIEESYKSGDETINSKWLKTIIYPELDKDNTSDTCFLSYCDTFLIQKGNNISEAYKTKVNSIKAILERYMAKRKIKQLNLQDIDTGFKIDFEEYCIETEKYSLNYFERNFKFIKTILFHAQQNGHQIFSGLSRIKCKTEKTTFEILTQEELDMIEQETFSDEHLETAKDWLLISCYCGQRVSDFMNFDVNRITEKFINGEKRFFIEFTQEKTGKQLLLPLHSKIVDILKKRDWSFPRKMSSVKYNLHIKKVCEYVGIDQLVKGSLAVKETQSEQIKKRKKNNRRKVVDYYPKYKLISSHVGRRTFSSLNFGKIPTPLLMVATGHSTPQMLMKYIGKIDEQQSLALAEYL